MGRCAHTAEECNTALPTDQLHFVRLSSASAARHFGFTAEKTLEVITAEKTHTAETLDCYMKT